MNTPTVEQLIPVLQTAVSPVILISGVGLLLLSMTNRLGRTLDRARNLIDQLPETPMEKRSNIEGQLQILLNRARLIRMSIMLVSYSALSAALLIVVLFFTVLWHLETWFFICFLFVVCMGALILSLIYFLLDVNHSLAALWLELKGAGRPIN